MKKSCRDFSKVNVVSSIGAGSAFFSLVAVLLVSCKPLDAKVSTAADTASGQAASIETLTAKANTVLKASFFAGTSGEVSCPIPQGTVLIVESLKHEGIDHWRLFDLMEVRLPTGEVAKVKRSLNEDSNQETKGAVEPTSASATQASVPTAIPTALPTTLPTASETTKTPAQLLNCSMLNNDNFLVVARDFNRLLSKAALQRRPDAASGSSEAVAVDDGVFSWPTKGRTIRNDSGGSGYFGAPRGSGRGHQGIDIVAGVGEPIYASRAGTIVDPSFEYSYGNVVDVKHEEGYLSRYAHLTAFSYSHGAYVEKGTKIASSGRSGNAAGYGITPHLHFEIRQYGRLLNPSRMLP
jgi:murein DD-endopeptidase MepM/ murein hydrolase activator NlpD